MTLSKLQPLFAVLLLLFFVGMSIYGVAEESIDIASHTLVSCVLVAGTNCSQACHVVDDDPYIFPTKKRWSSSHTVCKYAFVANVSYTFADVPYTAINVPVYDWYDTGPIRISDPGNCTVENGTTTTTIGRAWIAKDTPGSVVPSAKVAIELFGGVMGSARVSGVIVRRSSLWKQTSSPAVLSAR